jgi:hypothetical protein
MKPRHRFWIVPDNDLEAAEIQVFLAEAAESFVVTQQPWGASWANLEPAIHKQAQQFRQNENGIIFGVELAGPPLWQGQNVDHHWYSAEDRSNPKASIEQIEAILFQAGIPFDQSPQAARRRLLIAANDKGHIRELRRIGATAEEIADIRAEDRLRQGLTEADRTAAEHDLESADWKTVGKERRVRVLCADHPTSWHSDLLMERGATEILLMSEGSWSYSGSKHRQLRQQPFPPGEFWSGGMEDSGYFGIRTPGREAQQLILSLVWD